MSRSLAHLDVRFPIIIFLYDDFASPTPTRTRTGIHSRLLHDQWRLCCDHTEWNIQRSSSLCICLTTHSVLLRCILDLDARSASLGAAILLGWRGSDSLVSFLLLRLVVIVVIACTNGYILEITLHRVSSESNVNSCRLYQL